MPFRIDLQRIQQPKIWTSSDKSEAALKLQALYDQEKSEEYKALLAEYRSQFVKEKGNEDRELHDFRLTDGKVFEIWDRGERTATPIQFMVKGSVITWSFTAGKDETHQSWRDKVFNTAAIAHQSVEHGCETYYRGSNAYHLKKMHSHRGESDYNHNHYRLKEDRPISPKEVEEHLRGFYSQTYGKEFIPDPQEIDSIIGKYKIYWAEYELDPRYSKYYPLVDRNKKGVFLNALIAATDNTQREEAIDAYCTKIGVPQPVVDDGITALLKNANKLGAIHPLDVPNLKQAIDDFASSEHKTLKEAQFWARRNGLSAKYAEFIVSFNELASKVNFVHDFQAVKEYDWADVPLDSEVSEDDDYLPYLTKAVHGTHSQSGSPKSSVSSGSPSEQYNTAIDQMQNWDDEVEFKLFAEALTNRCRSIDDAMLGELRPEDFRKALRLYNAMKHLNNGRITTDESTHEFTISEHTVRFSEELFAKVLSLQSEISGLVSVEQDPGPALAPLFKWIKTAKPELEKWLKWVEENGSRGLGAEIAHTREQEGAKITRHSFFTEMDDRKPGATTNVLSLKPKSPSKDDMLAFAVRQYLQSIMHLMGEATYIDKSKVADVLIDVLEGRKTYDKIQPALEEFTRWNEVEKKDKIIKGALTDLVEQTQHLKGPETPTISVLK